MKKLTQEEANKLPKKYRGNLSPVYINILNLQPQENLLIEPKDWGRKYALTTMVRRLAKKSNRVYTVAHLAQNKGWVVSRQS